MSEKCINCGISNVPLVWRLDYQLHCEAYVQQLVVGAGQAAAEESENVKEETEEKKV